MACLVNQIVRVLLHHVHYYYWQYPQEQLAGIGILLLFPKPQVQSLILVSIFPGMYYFQSHKYNRSYCQICHHISFPLDLNLAFQSH